MALFAWKAIGAPLAAAGLVILVIMAAVAVPLVMLALVFMAPSAVAGLCVPRRWRCRYRHAQGHRPAIPRRLRRAVTVADRGQCVYCASRAQLQLDHVRPWASGGLTSLFNLVLLCGKCNRVKSDYWKDRDGFVHYRAWAGSKDMHQAVAILAAERRARRSPARWLRAALALAA